MENEIGIEVFYTKTPGIKGKLKARPEDFIVDEISILPPKIAENDGKYVIAKIRSRNWETNRLIRQFSRLLGISRKRISFAGTKDKRAITTQLMAFQTSIEELRRLSIADVEILDLYTSNTKIDLGDLIGNEFDIVIRDIEDDVKRNVEAVKKQILRSGGFLNFFGVQRFGAIRPITHIVGQYIILGDFKKAVHTYIGNPIKGENEEAYLAREYLEHTENYSEALKRFPKILGFERAVLNYLVRNPEDYVDALKELPKNLLMMFVHAYQSFLFNKILSERIKRDLPLNEPLIGDIVLPIDKNGLPNHNVWIAVNEKNIEKIKRKTKEKKAFISGLLYGSESRFAENEQGEIERRVINEENLKPQDFIIPKIREISSKGTRRELLAPLNTLALEIGDDQVRLKFKLTKGCYATCLLREFMKTEMRNY